MAENAAPRVMSVLTVNYQPAVEATKQLMGLTAQLDSQLRSLRITAANVGRNMEAQFNRPIQSGQVILDRHGQVLIDVGKKTEALAVGTQKVDDVAKKHTKTVQQTAQAYNVLGSQWERRISWFVAGAGFYGLIRAMRQAIDTFKQIEMDMVVIARTINDVTFNLEDMRDTLQDVGMQYGHTWDTVSDIAIRWTQAGYDMQDTLEQTRVGLLALNVAEMDVKMASEGLIAIMSQWGFTAEDLETVIDKLNITSDNFAVTTGDLVEALVRSSGAARAVKMSFDETLGIITATRVATGRLGREVGNAVNTILSFIVRQETINKLMESGIEVFADAAQTKLRPAIELISDIAEKWGDKAEEMPDQLLEIAEQMGLMSEEMSEVAGLQEEWTDLQKIDIETSAAGVRRRSYFIALLRNFAQVQEVVNNLQDVEGYSMRQNIMTMETLEKKQEQLNIAMERFAVVLGESGLMEQLKGVIEGTTELVEWFSNLNDTAKTLILTFAELAVAMRLLATLSKLMGGVGIATLLSGWAVPFTAGQSAAARIGMSALTASLTTVRGLLSKVVSLLGGPYVAATLAATTAIVTFVTMERRATEEQRRYLETINAVVEEQERLDNIMNKSVEGSTTYNLALEQKRELMKTIRERYPELIEDYDIENRMWVLNNELIKENIGLYEEMVASKKPEKSYLEKMEEEVSLWEQESQQLKNNATTVESLFRKRENLIKSIEEEGTTAEEAARKKDNIRRIDEAIIRIIGDFDDSIETSADITETAIDNIIEKYRQKAHEAELSSERAIKANQAEAIFLFSLVSSEKQRVLESLRATNQQIIAQEKYIESVMDAKTITEAYAITPPERAATLRTLEKERDVLMKQMDALEEQEEDYREVIREGNKALRERAEAIDDPGGGGDGGGEVKKLTDIISKFIETALRAADVQGMLNDETQRAVDASRAKIEYMTRENATAWEREEALREESRLQELLREKQEGIHREANFLREALAKLEQRQADLNTSTEEGWDAYKLLESQIESIKGSIAKLDIEWFELAKAQEETVVQAKKLQDKFKQLDFYARLGIISAKDLAIMTREAYSEIESIRSLTVTEEIDRINRLSGYYKDMFGDVLAEAEETYRARVKAMDKSVEEEIEIYQRMLDKLDEEKKEEDREESARQHINKMKDFYEQRRYHELRTGIEHQRAIKDLDKDIAEEERRWELQQSEWLRQDKKDAISRQIEDIKALAEKQRELWEQAYEKMQADFNDHNLSLIAVASAYDHAFFEDAFRKAQLWVEGFRTGMLGAGDYLGGMVPQASSIVFPTATQMRGEADQRPSSYSVEHPWGHTYTVSQGGHAIYKEGRLIPVENYKYLPEDIKQLARDMKVGLAHTGAMTMTPGIAELTPGELIFPPGLSMQLERLIGVLSARPLQSGTLAEGRVNNFYAPLFNSERTYVEDEADIELTARALKRQIANLD